MKEKRPRNELAWEMYRSSMTYEEIAQKLGITRQRAWAIVQNGLHRNLVELLSPVSGNEGYPHMEDGTIDKKVAGE